MSDITEFNKIKRHLLARVLSSDDTSDLFGSGARINETASYDFPSYELLYEPNVDANVPAKQPAGIEGMPSSIDDLWHTAILSAIASVLPSEWRYKYKETTFGAGFITTPRQGRYSDQSLTNACINSPFKFHSRPVLEAAYASQPDWYKDTWASNASLAFHTSLVAHFNEAINEIKLTANKDGFWPELATEAIYEGQNDRWREASLMAIQATEGPAEDTGEANSQPAASPTRTFGSGTFQPYGENSINFGLQLVFRQDWQEVGVQSGEIVKTIPLGPGQVEKVSVKSVRRNTAKREGSTETSSESSAERSDTSRDSTEVVEEALKASKFSLDASLQTEGIVSGGINASVSSNKSDSSKSTKSSLGESMSKAADTLRTKSRIVVSTEQVSEAELLQSSEISNTNDETAVTYVYSRLQRQYEIHTYLAEVNSVIMVGERLPMRSDMTPEWFRAKASILRGNLLDKSLESALTRVTSYIGNDSASGVDGRLAQLTQNIADQGLPDHSSVPGSPPDLLTSPLAAYERELQRDRTAQESRDAFNHALAVLRDHIITHQLFYGRMIWSAEDPAMRMLRYANIFVPKSWLYRPTYGAFVESVEGGWVPDSDNPKDMHRLSELIMPDGPIGFIGNYAIFNLREVPQTTDLLAGIATLRLPYLAVETLVTGGDLAKSAEIHAVVAPSVNVSRVIILDIVSRENGLGIKGRYRSAGQDWTHLDPMPLNAAGGALTFDWLKIRLTPREGNLKAGASVELRVEVMPRLADPELKQLRWTMGTPDTVFWQRTLTASVIADMAKVSDITDVQQGNYAEQTSEVKQQLHFAYPAYALRQQHTRRFLLDTNNVLLSRIVDNANTLEPFKGIHRAIDVINAIEELTLRRQENERRRSLLDEDDFSDPDIDQNIQIRGKGDVDIDI